ncbi:hypothetical protein [Oleomonas cavernae]|uniref:hypothetical protein n=1 Tax=Oleomonas cavernae TaxID=2320859 RepID=UPI0011C41DDF|nr:hypothetical protein [Oleomonas cavernae]
MNSIDYHPAPTADALFEALCRQRCAAPPPLAVRSAKQRVTAQERQIRKVLGHGHSYEVVAADLAQAYEIHLSGPTLRRYLNELAGVRAKSKAKPEEKAHCRKAGVSARPAMAPMAPASMLTPMATMTPASAPIIPTSPMHTSAPASPAPAPRDVEAAPIAKAPKNGDLDHLFDKSVVF